MSGIKCAGCGKFLGYAEMEPGGGAKHEFEPLSEFGPEVSDWICRKCNEREQQENMQVARAICEAEGGQWRERTEKPAVGMPHYYNFDRLNNHWRHKARAAILAMRRAAQERE